MSDSLKLFLVTSDDRGTTALSHIHTITIHVWTIHRLAASYHHAIGTLAAHATIVPGHEEIIIASVSHDERSLDSVRSSILRGRILHTVMVLG